VIGAAGRLGFVAVALRTSSVVEGVALTRERMLRQAALVTAVGVALAFWLSGTIVDPLRRVTLGARRIAEGDIGFDIATSTSRDEVGALSQAFATMRKRLRDLVTKIGSTSQALSTAATGMFSEVREQEALATQQTAALEEIQRTLETLSTAAEQVERDAQTVRTMAERNLSTSQQIAERTRMLSTHSDRIGEILSLIQDIADRSDLLALNAALEGTKAGEVGRGFSLVAAEMRRLSEHVKDSVRDIRKLVADMREASHASVLATEEGIRVSEETSTAAVKISDAIVRQREGTAQVKASADEIVNVVNESLEGRAETTSSAEALLTLSQELREAVSSFRVGAASSPSDEPRS
jgi:methyl-accepting chemotaxis protein